MSNHHLHKVAILQDTTLSIGAFMSQEELKTKLDKNNSHYSMSSNVPIVGGIIDWWNDTRQKFQSFLASDKNAKKRSIINFFIRYALILFILIYIVVVVVVNPRFLSFRNIINIFSQGSLLLMVSLGMAGIIVLTGADLSASSIVYFVVLFITTLIPNQIRPTGSGSGVYLIDGFTIPLIIAVIIAMILGGIIGTLNGIMTAKFKVHPFIGTMATNFVFGASALTLMYLLAVGGQSGGNAVVSSNSPIVELVTTGITIAGVTIPNIIWFALGAALIISIIWTKTKFGKSMFAVGCNQEAAKVAGVNVVLITTIVFAIAGIMYGYAAFFGIGYNKGGSAASYSTLGLYAIAACVIGGVSFTGGIGNVRGVIFGVLLFQMIRNSTNFIGFSSSVGDVFVGLVVAFAVIFDMMKYRTRT